MELNETKEVQLSQDYLIYLAVTAIGSVINFVQPDQLMKSELNPINAFVFIREMLEFCNLVKSDERIMRLASNYASRAADKMLGVINDNAR